MRNLIVGVDGELKKRVAIDLVKNRHGDSFLGFLRDCKFGIVNGRIEQGKDNLILVFQQGENR